MVHLSLFGAKSADQDLRDLAQRLPRLKIDIRFVFVRASLNEEVSEEEDIPSMHIKDLELEGHLRHSPEGAAKP